MMTDRELMQQALDALEKSWGEMYVDGTKARQLSEQTVEAIRARLAQPEPEPDYEAPIHKDIGWGRAAKTVRTAPPQRSSSATPREWQGLTKQEFEQSVDGLEDLEDCWTAIEAKLKEKNT